MNGEISVLESVEFSFRCHYSQVYFFDPDWEYLLETCYVEECADTDWYRLNTDLQSTNTTIEMDWSVRRKSDKVCRECRVALQYYSKYCISIPYLVFGTEREWRDYKKKPPPQWKRKKKPICGSNRSVRKLFVLDETTKTL